MKSFVLIKPDALKRKLDQVILNELKSLPCIITKQAEVVVEDEIILKHYHEVIVRLNIPGFKEMILDEFKNQKVIILQCEGDDDHLIQMIRTKIGATDPSLADPNSIRGRYGEDSLALAKASSRMIRNLIHASDSVEAAEFECDLWFNR
ncbi:MAG: nucleoside-diphosphate kinase [Erysipelotrichaceae bacterium]|nr:nucleoside-diphosphate kinase [Erysipelotrichaceae bacterium]MDP3305837.1 nucleoside-diphosphate kinase [Erysipelotrichaceae bacterium]